MLQKKKTLLISIPALILSFPVLFLLGWAAIYRLPPSPPVVVDMRLSPDVVPYYVLFCSSLADNTVAGYPGHCYVVWSRKVPVVFEQTESAGYVPRHMKDQIPSLYSAVPGLLVRDAWRGNLENFTSVTAIVDRETWERTMKITDTWSEDVFRVGIRDCVTFANTIAVAAGLKTPAPGFRYPQDYIKDLKKVDQPRRRSPQESSAHHVE